MCFSAPASFAAAAVLAVAGVMTVREAKQPSRLPLAVIPILFCIQQIAEGFFWLVQTDAIAPQWERPSMLLFLVFAQVVWPVWVPLSMLLPEQNKKRRKLMWLLLGAGLLFALHAGYSLFTYPVQGFVMDNHIAYRINFPGNGWKWLRPTVYLSVTLLPALISSVRRMPLLGIAILISFIVTFMLYPDHVISIWCYFAAIISVVVLYILKARDTSETEMQMATPVTKIR